MKMETYLTQFKANSPQKILKKIYKQNPHAKVGIQLSSGAYVEGFIAHIAIEQESYGSNEYICMYSEHDQVYYFSLNSIMLVTIFQPKSLAVTLSEGTISRPISEEKSMTVLQLKRWAKEQETDLGALIILPSEGMDAENNRLNIQDIINSLHVAVNGITKDSMGREAWNAITEVVVGNTEGTLSVGRSNAKLSIHINYLKALPEDLTTQLEHQLTNVL